MTAARTIAPFISLSVSSISTLFLTRYLSHRQIGAGTEFQGSGLFTTARRECDNGHNRADDDHASDVHGLLS
jgi:hypothetical protein